ncbi:hypothetical protein SAMN05421847_0041 [Halpernia humi]|uniref:Uncharacterized protein n=1 Tax=Halpernia humi TaxID=493375 RepID=A0A1H5S453_9FLAO|nr:hypothetical protein SAMN05421847_0041 [Halpernia humi]
MSGWYNFLYNNLPKNELNNYTEIFYLGSCNTLEIEKINTAISNKNIYELLSNCKVDCKKDSLDFFWLKNKTSSKISIIFDPVELFENSILYKTIFDFENCNFTKLPNFEKIK